MDANNVSWNHGLDGTGDSDRSRRFSSRSTANGADRNGSRSSGRGLASLGIGGRLIPSMGFTSKTTPAREHID